MTHPSKVKGSKFERDAADYLDECGIHAERIPAGATQDRGDIWVPDWTIECKNQARFELAGWMNETLAEQEARHTPWHALWVHRRGKSSPADGYAVMTGRQLASLILEVAR